MEKDASPPALSALALEVRALLKQRNLSQRRGAQTADMAPSSLNRLANLRQGAAEIGPGQRDYLVQLGMDRDRVEKLARLAALKLSPAEAAVIAELWELPSHEGQ